MLDDQNGACERTGSQIVRDSHAEHIDMVMDMGPLWSDEAFLDKPLTGAGPQEAVSLLVYGTLRAKRAEAAL